MILFSCERSNIINPKATPPNPSPWRIPLFDLDYGPAEEEAALRVLRSKWLTMGAETQQFEAEFAGMLNLRVENGESRVDNTPLSPLYSLAVGNATQALHLACLALEIGPGDEVIVPSLTFVATANAACYTGAAVRFADVLGPDDLTISPASIAAQITPRTKAIIVMHYAGYPCAMPEIMALARQHGLAVIEDAAHAPGAYLKGRALGTWGDVGCFSFFSNKNLAVGEGGMVVTRRLELAERLRLLRSHGMTTLTLDRHLGRAYSYDVLALGYNYRLDELRAALGLVQLEKLAANNARRRALTRQYWQALSALVPLGLDLPFRSAFEQGDAGLHQQSTYHIFPILLPEGVNRYAFIDRMRAAGIQTSIHYPPIHHFSHYQAAYPRVVLPITEALAAREVTLPLYPGLTSDQIDLVVAATRQALAAR